MSDFDFDEIRIFDDKVEDVEMLKKIISAENQEDSFYMLNVEHVVRAHKLWLRKIPRVVPHYAVKCNSNATVIKVLAALNASFDCASKQEIVQVMQYGVPGERIIFANPMKLPTHIQYAKKVGVNVTTADSEVELRKIKEHFPQAKIVIRIRCDAAVSEAYLGLKFGCDPGQEAVRLIHMTKELGLELHGFSFHVGSPCGEVEAMSRGIGICKRLIDVAKSIGCADVRMIDIGGGIPGESDFILDEFADVINEALQDIDPSITVISEPGRYYVTSAFTLAAYLHGKKSIIDEDRIHHMYYANEGVYGSFLEALLDFKPRIPTALSSLENTNSKQTEEKKYLSTLWGPTCDSFDCVLKKIYLPEYHVGDWLLWWDIGAYSLSLSVAGFNGFTPANVYPVMRRSAWDALLEDINQQPKPKDIELIRVNGRSMECNGTQKIYDNQITHADNSC